MILNKTTDVFYQNMLFPSKGGKVTVPDSYIDAMRDVADEGDPRIHTYPDPENPVLDSPYRNMVKKPLDGHGGDAISQLNERINTLETENQVLKDASAKSSKKKKPATADEVDSLLAS